MEASWRHLQWPGLLHLFYHIEIYPQLNQGTWSAKSYAKKKEMLIYWYSKLSERLILNNIARIVYVLCICSYFLCVEYMLAYTWNRFQTDSRWFMFTHNFVIGICLAYTPAYTPHTKSRNILYHTMKQHLYVTPLANSSVISRWILAKF